MNMQKGTLTIGEISEILNVPTSTLRFWEEKGLFQVAKGLNSYRSYTTTDLIHIADILFYRNMGIPVKDVGGFHVSFSLRAWRGPEIRSGAAYGKDTEV